MRKRIRRCNAMTAGVETLRRACVQGVELQRKGCECIEALETTAITKAVLVGEEMWNRLKCEGSGGLFFRFKDLDQCRMPRSVTGDDCRQNSGQLSAAHKAFANRPFFNSNIKTPNFHDWGTIYLCCRIALQLEEQPCSLAPPSRLHYYLLNQKLSNHGTNTRSNRVAIHRPGGNTKCPGGDIHLEHQHCLCRCLLTEWCFSISEHK